MSKRYFTHLTSLFSFKTEKREKEKRKKKDAATQKMRLCTWVAIETATHSLSFLRGTDVSSDPFMKKVARMLLSVMEDSDLLYESQLKTLKETEDLIRSLKKTALLSKGGKPHWDPDSGPMGNEKKSSKPTVALKYKFK